ncbi:ATP-binding protein [Kineosporia sp. J2-2]|uniref:ATP-binding protein n=1 Tax=Kineosporia corallincola TaxID=2835133 RepID=A0ABS5TMQ1_9ACTN|nr:ATP-binding protein [Kineosporia corallincola]MBT0771476.1 ATP-binding protein [Kineosporia corallincola]
MDTFEAAGGRFDLAAADEVIARVLTGPDGITHPVLTGTGTGTPQLGLFCTREPGGVRLEGRITLREPGFDGPLHQFMIGADQVAPVLEALGRLFEGPPGRPLTEGELTATTLAGRPLLDGRVTDRALVTVPADRLTARTLAALLRITVRLGARRAGAAPYLAGRAFRIGLPGETTGAADEPDAVRLDDLGGLDEVVAQLRDVADSFRHPEVMARWGARRPQGILMWGPPGTGKTTLARALAQEIGGTLEEVRSSDILDRWMGASERNITRVFERARRYTSPTVLLFDEFDSIIGYAGRPRGSADQAVNSVAGIFKQQMNDLAEVNPNVIVVATTNFPDRVDESLIRSGRFDVKLAVPLPGARARADILAKQIRSLQNRHTADGFRMFADDLDVSGLARQAAGLSGADLAEVLRRARLEKAMAEARGGAPGPITQADLLRGIERLTRATT